ncbi:MAG: DUF3084 domain-containing protein [Prochlorococcaceae cyanobacterium MAG_34]|nr:DUF3084 domain-containing protein [Cyanobium sp. MAG_185]MDP5118883.1 DUF3084 domain-containing protein [Prochlorococcaceae cyanobacterium MAG_34]
MTGWLLILALLALGGVLSTLGDRLGSLVGKARLSLLGMRPRRTAVLITVLTGSLISAISLGLMLLVSERLRTGLFELDRLEQRLQTSRLEVARAEQGKREAQTRFEQAQSRASKLRQELAPLLDQRNRLELERSRLSQEVKGRDAEIRRTEAELAQVRRRISASAQELKDLEGTLIALRRGAVVLSSGQTLASAKVNLERPEQATEVITALLQQANLNAFRRVLPGQPADRQILLVPKNDISKLEGLLAKPGSWVVSILSAANVLRGERQVLAFPDLRPNRPVVKAGEVLASTTIEGDLTALEPVSRRLNLLLAAAYARAQRQGTLVEGLQFDAASFKQLARELSERQPGQVAQLEALAINSASTADPIAVELRWLAAPAPAQSGAGPRRP